MWSPCGAFWGPRPQNPGCLRDFGALRAPPRDAGGGMKITYPKSLLYRERRLRSQLWYLSRLSREPPLTPIGACRHFFGGAMDGTLQGQRLCHRPLQDVASGLNVFVFNFCGRDFLKWVKYVLAERGQVPPTCNWAGVRIVPIGNIKLN